MRDLVSLRHVKILTSHMMKIDNHMTMYMCRNV